MRLRFAILAAPMAASLAALPALAPAAFAKSNLQDFIIAGNDGYGTQECLGKQLSCGRIVADAWCEAKGFKNAQSYRAAGPDEITGSVTDTAHGRTDAFVITCRQ